MPRHIRWAQWGGMQEEFITEVIWLLAGQHDQKDDWEASCLGYSSPRSTQMQLERMCKEGSPPLQTPLAPHMPTLSSNLRIHCLLCFGCDL